MSDPEHHIVLSKDWSETFLELLVDPKKTQDGREKPPTRVKITHPPCHLQSKKSSAGR